MDVHSIRLGYSCSLSSTVVPRQPLSISAEHGLTQIAFLAWIPSPIRSAVVQQVVRILPNKDGLVFRVEFANHKCVSVGVPYSFIGSRRYFAEFTLGGRTARRSLVVGVRPASIAANRLPSSPNLTEHSRGKHEEVSTNHVATDAFARPARAKPSGPSPRTWIATNNNPRRLQITKPPRAGGLRRNEARIMRPSLQAPAARTARRSCRRRSKVPSIPWDAGRS